MIRQTRTEDMKGNLLFIVLTSVVAALGAVPDISFKSNPWTFTQQTGVIYDNVNGVLSFTGDTNEYQFARLAVDFSNKPSTLYLVADVYFDGYVNGSLSYGRAKIKASTSSGNKIVKSFDESEVLSKTWVTTIVPIDNFSQWTGSVTIEFAMQNARGIYKVKNPRLYDAAPPATPYSFPWTVPANPAVSVSIDTHTMTEFPSSILSMNSHFAWSSFSWSDTVLRRIILNDFPMKNLRFPGGTVGNFYNWTTDEFYDDAWTAENASRKTLADQNWKFDFPGYASLCQELGATSTLMFNVIEDDVTKSKNRLADRLSKGLDVAWVELGNENFFPDQAFGYVADGDHVVSAKKYIAHTKALTAGLKSIDPNVKVAVNVDISQYGSGTWTDSISKENYYDDVVIHSYFKMDESILSPTSGKGLLSGYKRTLADLREFKTHFPNNGAIVTEWGILNSPNSFLWIMCVADRFLAFLEGAEEGIVKQAGLHILANGDAWQLGSLIYKQGEAGYFTHTGILYSSLFKTFMGKSLYKSTVNAPLLEDNLSSMTAATVEDGDSVAIFAVNRLPVASPLTILIDGNTYSGGYSMRVLHEEPTTVLAEASPKFTKSTDWWKTSSGTGTPSIPAYSIVVLKVSKQGSPSSAIATMKIKRISPHSSLSKFNLIGQKVY